MADPAVTGAPGHGEKRRGRPTGKANRKTVESLFDALETCLSERSYLDLTLRDIAACAGINHAMIRYYFADKDGLVLAMVERMLDGMIADMQDLLDRIGVLHGSPMRHFVACMAGHVARNPEIARVAVIEVARRGSLLGERFRQRQMVRILTGCQSFIDELIRMGLYRADLDRKFAVEMVAGVITFILIPLPNMPVLGVAADDYGSERWIDGVTQMLDHYFSSGFAARNDR